MSTEGTTNPHPEAVKFEDPFANQRDASDPINSEPRTSADGGENIVPMSQRDRRMSKEWDASKVPPSRFQKLEGSIFATPGSRDGHVARNKREFGVGVIKEKIKEKTTTKERKKSVGSGGSP